MAASATPSRVEATLKKSPRGRAPGLGIERNAVPTVAVAVSGGRDSTALLHATVAQAPRLKLQVLALHVHHGLQLGADAWLDHVRRQCRRWAARGAPLRFQSCRLNGRPADGESTEAWARRERYAALARLAHAEGASAVLLAHHRRDQAETFLLQALRGAGAAGLAAMPRVLRRQGITWLRPWLACGDDAIDAYVRRHRLSHVDDPSNRDLSLDRNRLRAGVMPALRQAFPQAEEALCAAATRAQEAQACLHQIALADLQPLIDDGALLVNRWQALPEPRALNVLRHWLRGQLGRGAGETLVQRLRLELARPGAAHWQAGSVVLRRYRGRLTCETPASMGAPAAATAFSVAGAGAYPVAPWPGMLHVAPVAADGIALARLQACELRPRAGSEQFQHAPGATPRSLKKQFQAAGVPPWQRDGPLLYGDDQLLFVPGLGIDARARAAPHEVQMSLHWQREA